MSEIRKLQDILKFSLENPPPPLPPAALERLRDAIDEYRRGRGYKGWTTFYKREMGPFTREELDRYDALRVEGFKRRMDYWCGKEQGDLQEPRLIYILTKLLYEKSPETLSLWFDEVNYINTGNILTKFFNVTGDYSDFSDVVATLEPDVYGICGVNDFKGIREYIVVTDIGEPLFLKLNRFGWREKFRRITDASVGYYLHKRKNPIVLLKDRLHKICYVNQCCGIDPRGLIRAPIDPDRYAMSLGPLNYVTDPLHAALYRETDFVHLERQIDLSTSLRSAIDLMRWGY